MEKSNTVLEKNLNLKSGEENINFENSFLIKDFIVDNFLFGDSENFNENTDLFQESIVDSTGILELISYLEVTFKIRVNDEDILLENFCSLNSIKSFIRSKLN